MKKYLIKLFLIFLILIGSLNLITTYQIENNTNLIQKELTYRKNNKINQNYNKIIQEVKKEDCSQTLQKNKSKKGLFKNLKWYWHVLIWLGFAILTIPLTILKRRWRKRRKK